jgi:outer membrane receptor for ferrienterochelin and colicins
MKKIYIVFLLTLLGMKLINAQQKHTDANLIGDVQCNGEHVPFVNVTIDGTTLGTATDATGHFQIIDIPEGTYTVRVSGLGYKTTTQQFTAVSNKTTEIKFVIEEDVLGLDEVVVSADRNQTNRKEAPVVVTTLSPKLFEITQSNNLAEGLCFTPGLRTETNCQNCGFTQLRMNGMEGPYTQILMNSRPVFSGLAGVYGLELIPANMIERLEIVRGGGSTLFGGNAIAGTVNIITKETRKNSLEVDNRFGIIGTGTQGAGEPALDNQLSVNASVVSDDNKTGGYLYAMLRNRDAWDANNDDFTELVEMKNTTFGFNVFHKPGAKSKISLDGYRVSEYRRGGNKLDYLPHEADISEQLEHLITGGNLAYELYTNGNHNKLTLYASAQQVDRDSYYGAEQDPNAYGNTSNLSSSLGAQYVINSTKFLFPSSKTIFGIDNSNDYLDDRKLGANGDANTTLTNQFVNTLGSFVQQDWKSDKFNLSAGIRYDYYLVRDLENTEGSNGDLSNGVFVPRASLLYKITPDIRIRAGYAKGYRAPQVFNEDLHIELVNATRVQTINSDDLIQETSHALTASFNADFVVGSSPISFLAEGFYTKLENPFSDEFYDPEDDGNFVYLRVNAEDGAYVTGANFELKTFITPKFETQLGFTIQKSAFETEQAWGEEETSVSKDFMRTPNQYGYATFIWSPKKHFNANVSLNYTGSMLVPHFGLSQEDYDDAVADGTINAGDVIVGERLEKSKDFVTADLQFSYDFDLTGNHQTELQIYAGVKNIFNQYQDDFDKGVYRDAGYLYGPRMPRTINIGIKLSKF